jgi:hypothetical protein
MAPICTTDDAKFCTVNVEARWRSGDAEDCKSLHAGSIPARASKILSTCVHIRPETGYFLGKNCGMVVSINSEPSA